MTRPAEIPGYLGRVLTPTSTPDDRVGVGTCFQVEPGIVVTAWHVLDDLGLAQPGAEVLVDQLGAGTPAPPVLRARVHALDPLRDVAVLTVAGGLRASVTGLVATDSVGAGTGVAVTGVALVPGVQLRYSSAAGTWEGPAMYADQVALGVLKASGIAKGMSGGPVRRQHDDRVIGVVSGRYNSADGWQQHQVWIARVEDLLPLLPDIAHVRVADAASRGAPLDVTLTVSPGTVRLTGPGIDVTAPHRGVGQGLRNALHDVRRERTARGRLDTRAQNATAVQGPGVLSLRHSGQLLAESFLPDPVRQALDGLLRQAERTSAPLRMAIDAPGFTMLPWEALPDPTTAQPLALHPLVYLYRQSTAAAGPTALPGPLRIVVAIASPDTGSGPLLDYEHELGAVLDAVRSARQDNAHVDVVPFATTAAIRAALNGGGAHVLHVSAHGGPGVLHLEDDRGNARRVTPDEFLAEAIPAGQMPPVISLAACYTDAIGEEQGASYAAQLAARGACAVIATQTSVTDAYATRLFARVYAELAAAERPDIIRAVADARRALQLDLARATKPLDNLLAGMDEWSVVTILAASAHVDVLDPTATTPVPAPPATELGGLLARPVGQFVGRRPQQRHLPAVLHGDTYGGVLLHGIGGIGKTTLAAEIIRRAAGHAESWRVVTLTGPLSVDGILAAVAGVVRRDLLRRQITHGPRTTAVQVAGRVDVPWQDRLGLLRADILGDTPVLLVLDNFEDNLTGTAEDTGTGVAGWRVGDPAVAGLLAAWLADPGRGRLLITSRYPFSLPGHAVDRLYSLQVPPLSLAETRKLLWSLPNLDRYAIDTEAQERIWRQVGGHPRSLEYLDALLGGGKGRFPDITRRLHAAVEARLDTDEVTRWLAQDRTLDTAIAQVATLAADDVLLTSHLTELARIPGAVRLLAGISVYREPVDQYGVLFQVGTPNPDAAYTPDRKDLVAQITALLADHHFTPDDLPAVLADPGTLTPADRDRLHHLLNQYDDELPRPPLDPPPGLPALLRHLADSSLITQVGNRVVMHPWTATELHNRWNDPGSPHTQPESVTAAHLAAAAYWQWRVRAWPQDRVADVHDRIEARHHLLAAGELDAAGDLTANVCGQLDQWGAWDQETSLIYDTLRWLPEDSPRRAGWYHQLGILAEGRGDYVEGERRYRQALTLSEELGDRAGAAAGYHQLGIIAQRTGDYPEAERRYQRALTIFEELGNRADAARSYHQLGILARERGDYAEAEHRYRHALTILEELDGRASTARSYIELGNLAYQRGDYREAERCYQQSLTINEEVNDRAGMANSYQGLGILAQEGGNYPEAERRYQQAITIFEELGNRTGMASNYHQLGMLAQAQGDYAEAERRYQQALTIEEELGNRVSIASSHHQLGILAQLRGDYPEGERRYHEALNIFEELGDRANAARSYHQLGILALQRENYPEAERRIQQALSVFEELGNRAGIASGHHQLGMLAQAQRDYPEAERRYRQAMAISEELGDPSGTASTVSQLGILKSEAGHPREAVPLHCRALAIRIQIGAPRMRIDINRLHALRAELGTATFTEITTAILDEESRHNLQEILDQVDAS